MTKSLILSVHLGFGGHLELPNDANLASSRFKIRIPIPTYFCKNIFYRRYCTVILDSGRTNCAEYWLKERQENTGRCTGRPDITVILLKTALNTSESINQSINQRLHWINQFLSHCLRLF